MKRRLWPIRRFFRSLDNWRRGFKFGYVRRCRRCGHTAYYKDGHYGRGWGCLPDQTETLRPAPDA